MKIDDAASFCPGVHMAPEKDLNRCLVAAVRALERGPLSSVGVACVA